MQWLWWHTIVQHFIIFSKTGKPAKRQKKEPGDPTGSIIVISEHVTPSPKKIPTQETTCQEVSPTGPTWLVHIGPDNDWYCSGLLSPELGSKAMSIKNSDSTSDVSEAGVWVYRVHVYYCIHVCLVGSVCARDINMVIKYLWNMFYVIHNNNVSIAESTQILQEHVRPAGEGRWTGGEGRWTREQVSNSVGQPTMVNPAI